MKLYKLYETTIVENNVNNCVKLFGNSLFGDELGGGEKNTPIENKYKDEIVDFTDNKYGEEITTDFIEAINSLKNCMNQYPEVLVPDDGLVFRGTVIPITYFVNKKQPINIEGANNYVYKGYSKIQSWTTDHTVANVFSDNEMINKLADSLYIEDYNTPKKRRQLLDDVIEEDLRIAFRLNYVTSPNDFMFKAKYLNRLSYNGDEYEIIRVNNSPINVNAYIKINMIGGVNKNGIKLLQYLNMAILSK